MNQRFLSSAFQIPVIGIAALWGMPQLQAGAAPAFTTKAPSATDIRAAHVFEEPLLPLGAAPTGEENQALAQAIETYQKGGESEALGPFEAFLQAFPRSSWRASLMGNLGIAYRHTGYFSKALDAWEEAWKLSKADTTVEGRAVADRAVGELLELNARVGRMGRMKELFAEISTRPVQGAASEHVARARSGFDMMEHQPEVAFRCGPMALASIIAAQGGAIADERLDKCHSTQQGTTLLQNFQWAKELGLKLQMAKRQPGAAVLFPALVNWKAGHYAAVVKARDGRYLVQDPTFGEELWVSRAALDAEGSGYALVPLGKLPKGWASVSDQEAQKIWGRGNAGPRKPDDPGDGPDEPKSCPANPTGMPSYSLDTAHQSLKFRDNPVGYAPPRGNAVKFELNYNHRDAWQPQTFSYSNIGPKWSFGWLSYLTDDPAHPGQTVSLYASSARCSQYTGFDAASQSYANQFNHQDKLTLTGPSTYARLLPDGSQEIFDRADGAAAFPRRVFMTKRIDPAGNVLSFGYDNQLRLVTVTDALGKVTTLSYELGNDPYKVTRVTDPFGRTAVLTYANGLLASITDAVGMTSSFSYGPTAAATYLPPDFINAMNTPYGTHGFLVGGADVPGSPSPLSGLAMPSTCAWIQVNDPLGEKELLAFWPVAPGISNYDPQGAPGGFGNDNLQWRDVYFWDKRATATGLGDFTKARVYHFLHTQDLSMMSSVLESEKKPLESRVWYRYSGQAGGYPSWTEGSSSQPSFKYQKQDDGIWQVNAYQYNAFGKVTQSTDPMNRVTRYVYAANNLDLLEVHNNSTVGVDDLLASYTYNTLHKPLSATDAAGQTTTFAYNTWGQTTTITNPKHETTTLSYDGSGYLQSVTGPLAGATTSFGYDSAGRMSTVTNSDGDMVTTSFDNLDRPTKVSFLDGTFQQTLYDRLDVGASRDRQGNWTFMTYNPLRQLVQVQDAQGRETRLSWCGCGSQLESLTDPMGHITTWMRDLQGRVVSKLYDDHSQTQYAYDGVGRLAQRTDAKGQITLYAYNPDSTLAKVSYPVAEHATPTVSYTYDARYNRLATMLDGTGTTTYAYNPVTTTPALGAGRLATVSSTAFPNGDITYAYDELGRVTSRAVNGVAEVRSYDALGRISQVNNPLGLFTYSYDGVSGRLLNIAYPNGQSANFSYFDGLGSRRLKEIKNQKSDGTPISVFDYTYDTNGQIQTWSQQADVAAPKTYTFQYDAVGQVLGATLTDNVGSIVHQYAYGYDQAGNRVSEQIDNLTTTADYNDVNQLTHQRSSTNSLAGIAAPKGTASPSKAKPGGAEGTVKAKPKSAGAKTAARPRASQK